MIDFEDLKDATIEIVEALTGLDAVAYEDDQRPVPATEQGAIALFSFFGVAQIGQDETRYERDTSEEYGVGGDSSELPEGGIEPPVIETVIGRREITLRIKVESIYADGNFDALFYLERMRTRLYRTSTRELFRAAGLGFQEVLTATTVNETRDEHRVPVAILDIRCNVVALDVDEDNPHPTIERVDVLGRRR